MSAMIDVVIADYNVDAKRVYARASGGSIVYDFAATCPTASPRSRPWLPTCGSDPERGTGRPRSPVSHPRHERLLRPVQRERVQHLHRCTERSLRRPERAVDRPSLAAASPATPGPRVQAATTAQHIVRRAGTMTLRQLPFGEQWIWDFVSEYELRRRRVLEPDDLLPDSPRDSELPVLVSRPADPGRPLQRLQRSQRPLHALTWLLPARRDRRRGGGGGSPHLGSRVRAARSGARGARVVGRS